MTLVEDAEVQYCCTEYPVALPLINFCFSTVIFREKSSHCFPELRQRLLIASNNQYKLEVVWVCYYHWDFLKYILEWSLWLSSFEMQNLRSERNSVSSVARKCGTLGIN